MKQGGCSRGRSTYDLEGLDSTGGVSHRGGEGIILKTKTSSGKPVTENIWSCSLMRIKEVGIVIF